MGSIPRGGVAGSQIGHMLTSLPIARLSLDDGPLKLGVSPIFTASERLLADFFEAC